MTWQVPSKAINTLPLIHASHESSVDLYSLYKRTNRSYNRVSSNAYPPKIACKVFGERLGANPLELSIRRIKIESDGVNLRYGR